MKRTSLHQQELPTDFTNGAPEVTSHRTLAQVRGGISMPTMQPVRTDDLGGFNFELNGDDRYLK